MSIFVSETNHISSPQNYLKTLNLRNSLDLNYFFVKNISN